MKNGQKVMVNKAGHSIEGIIGEVLRSGEGNMAGMFKVGVSLPVAPDKNEWQTWWFKESELTVMHQLVSA
jgi:hypothetical protein